jgi:glyceraldehyde 3-phosphate dehydrogenase
MSSSKKASDTRIGINGFGRIGRLLTRVLMQKHLFHIVAINDPVLNARSMAYLLKYDSVHGKFPMDVVVESDHMLKINGCSIQIFSEADASHIPWGEAKVEIVAECSGFYTSNKKSEAHLSAGAKHVVISAPADNTPVFVMGVNQESYDPRSMHIISNGSCTTNCLVPLLKVVNDMYGIEECLVTAVHAVTATQKTVDGECHKDLRAGRAYARNIIPATTGASRAVTQALPELEGKVGAMSLRVPVENVSVVDATCRLTRPMRSKDDLAQHILQIEHNKKDPLHGILGVTFDPVVSSDFNGDERSSIWDVEASLMLNPTFVKLIAYYDNEWAYAVRLADLMEFIDCRNHENHK